MRSRKKEEEEEEKSAALTGRRCGAALLKGTSVPGAGACGAREENSPSVMKKKRKNRIIMGSNSHCSGLGFEHHPGGIGKGEK